MERSETKGLEQEQRERKMIPISALEVIGFQIHKYSLLEFDPGVNLIIGDNDNGKSALMRALRWVYDNKPLGESFINEEMDKAEVNVELDEEHTVTRRRSKKENVYEVNGEVLQAMRGSVPSEVSSVLDISSVTVHKQHDPLYMLQQTSSGERAKAINEIIGLEVIDNSLRSINSIISASKKEKEFARMKLAEQAKKMAALSWMKDAEAIFTKIQRRKIAWKVVIDQYNRLQELISDHQILWEKIEVGQDLLQTKPNFDKAEEILLQIKALKDSQASLTAQINKHKYYHNQRTIAEQITKQKKRIDRARALLEELEDMIAERNKLAKLLLKVRSTRKKLKEAKSDRASVKKSYDIVVKKLDICPLCGATKDCFHMELS